MSDIAAAGLGIAARIRYLIGPEHDVVLDGRRAIVDGPQTRRIFDFDAERCTVRFTAAPRGDGLDVHFSTLTEDGRRLVALLQKLVDAPRPVAAEPAPKPVPRGLDAAGPQARAELQRLLAPRETVTISPGAAVVEGSRTVRSFDFARQTCRIDFADAPGADVPPTPISALNPAGQRLAAVLGRIVAAEDAAQAAEIAAARKAPEAARRRADPYRSDSGLPWSSSPAPSVDLSWMAPIFS